MQTVTVSNYNPYIFSKEYNKYVVAQDEKRLCDRVSLKSLKEKAKTQGILATM